MSDTIPAVLLEDPDQDEGEPFQLDAKPDVGETVEYNGTEYTVKNVVHNDTKWAGRLGVIVQQ